MYITNKIQKIKASIHSFIQPTSNETFRLLSHMLLSTASPHLGEESTLYDPEIYVAFCFLRVLRCTINLI